MEYTNLGELLLIKLQALYDVESEILKALPKMAKKATNKDLTAGFERHLEETKAHKERLEKIFEFFEVKPKKLKVEAIRGIIADGEWMMKQKMSEDALDISLIGSAQHVEHYEISGYGTAHQWAQALEFREIAKLLDKTLQEEQKTGEKLTQIAKRLNQKIVKEI